MLDNFEHVVEAANDVATLLAACAGIKVLVTSRFALRLSMEREFPLSPLRTPRETSARNPQALQSFPSVQLFAERAAAVKPEFRLDEESTIAVAEICQKLDGLPLAIELAAARIKLFPPRALLARLDRRLELLSGGARDLPERHQTLRQAIRWSYDLLDPGEQSAFRRLAVFAAGCSIDAAETVCAAAGPPVLPALDAVAALVDKSLLRQDSAGNGEPRFLMLETVREFALEQLVASGEENMTRTAHADVFLALAEAAAPELSGPGQQVWLPRLSREHDDLRAAFDWTIRSRDTTRALRLAAALSRFWIIRGFHTEGRQRMHAALALPYEQDHAALRARVLSGAAILAFEQADIADAGPLLEQALEHFRSLDDTGGVAETLNHMGWVQFIAGRLDRAEALSEEARALHEHRGDTRGMALSLTNLGSVVLQRGELHRARDIFAEALELRRSQRDPRSIAYGSLNFGWCLVRLGELDRATALALEADATLRELGDKQLLAFACFLRGEIALERGEPREALSVLEESARLGREVMRGASLGLALTSLGEALALTGDHEKALASIDEALAIYRSSGTPVWSVIALRSRGEALRLRGDAVGARASYTDALRLALPDRLRFHSAVNLTGLAALESAQQRHEQATRFAAAALQWFEATGGPRPRRGPDIDAILAAAERALGPERVAALQAKARRLDPSAQLQEVLRSA